MESFELIDNFFQIVVLLCAAAAAGIFALWRRSRDLLILSLAYFRSRCCSAPVSLPVFLPFVTGTAAS